MAQEDRQDLPQDLKFRLDGVCSPFAAPGGDQVGAVHPCRWGRLGDFSVALLLYGPFVAAQIPVLPHVVEEEVDGGQRDRGRWKSVIGGQERDAHLLGQGRRQEFPEQDFQSFVQVVDHAKAR